MQGFGAGAGAAGQQSGDAGTGGVNGPETDNDEAIAKSYPMVTMLKDGEWEPQRVSARAYPMVTMLKDEEWEPQRVSARVPVQSDVWTRYPEGINHFEPTAWHLQDKKLMLQCKFCPWTRLTELKGGNFKSWRNPVACRRDSGDQARNAKTHVDGQRNTGNRGWHQFWYSVHSLYPELAALPGAEAGGGGPPGDRPLMMEWLQRKVKDYPYCKSDFVGAGLLVPGGAGAAHGNLDKFSKADEVLRILRQVHPGMVAQPKAKRSRPAPCPAIDICSPSIYSDADIADSFLCDSTADTEGCDDGAGTPKRVKTEVHSPDRGQAIGDWSPQHAILPPPAEADSPHSSLVAYSVGDQNPVSLLYWDDDNVSLRAGASSDAADGGAASGAVVQPPQSRQVSSAPSLAEASATAPQDPTGGLGRYPANHRPVFNVFLDAMTGVEFQTAQSEEIWSSYDVNRDFERSQEFGLAQAIGAYLHRGEVKSPVLDLFDQDLRYHSAGPLAYFQQLQALQAPALMPVVKASLGAIYCYWRIERELLHVSYSDQLTRWQGDEIRGRLVDILRQLHQDADPAHLEQELKAFFAVIDLEIRRRLRKCSDILRYYCSNTGSFAQVVRAPRIWCFFLVLRLRHDADFSRALWDKGFRFVGVLLDPLRVAPRGRDDWITDATGLLSGTSPGGEAGQGGGGQAFNPFIDTPDETTEMKLVAQLLAAEGKEVDVATRAEEGEDVELPPVSERKSLTAARLHLVSQGLVCVCWGRWVLGCGCGCGCGCLYVSCVWVGGELDGWAWVYVSVCASEHCFCARECGCGLSLPPLTVSVFVQAVSVPCSPCD
jgi:hypothetical protein